MKYPSFLRELASVLMRAAVIIGSIVLIIATLGWLYEAETGISDGFCNVAVFPVEGTILPFNGLIDVPLTITPEAVDGFITAAEEEDAIEAILLEFNSPGGTPVASERIAERIANARKPVIGLVGDLAASGGYLVAAATDQLIASPMSTVGSIGVSMSYLEESKKHEEDGVTYVELTSGEFKDAGSSDKPLTEAERALFQRDIDLVHAEFVSLVATYRNMSTSSVQELADGSTVTGVTALDVGLIDTLGGRAEAVGVLAAHIGQNPDHVELCPYNGGFLPF